MIGVTLYNPGREKERKKQIDEKKGERANYLNNGRETKIFKKNYEKFNL